MLFFYLYFYLVSERKLHHLLHAREDLGEIHVSRVLTNPLRVKNKHCIANNVEKITLATEEGEELAFHGAVGQIRFLTRHTVGG